MRTMASLFSAVLLLAPAWAFGQAEESLPPLSTETADVARVVGPPRGQPRSGLELDAKTYQVGGLLRCPVCQGLSVSDSPSGMAQNMKGQVRDLLAAGFDQEQILAYFERSFGESVLLRPPLRGVNWLVWLGPILGLLVGAVVVIGVLRQRATAAGVGRAAPSAAAVPGPDTLPDDPELRPYVLRVRELAYGWPGGVSPEKGGA